MKEETVKVNCSFCGKEIECPKNMLDSKKHACFECYMNIGKWASKEDLGKVHVDIPPDKADGMMPQLMADSMTNEIFPHIWKEHKSRFRGLSNEMIAGSMFAIGAQCAFESIAGNWKQKNRKS